MSDLSLLLEASNLNRICAAVSFTIVCYDYILTLPDEVRLFWQRKDTSWGALLFYLCRYLAIVGYLPILYASFASVDIVLCYELQFYRQIFNSVASALISIVLIMRTSALYSQDPRVVCLLIITFIIVTVVSAVLLDVVHLAPSVPLPPGYSSFRDCKVVLGQIQGYYCTGVWACTIISDTMMYILTVWKAFSDLSSVTVRHSLFRVLFFNGTAYFGVLIVLYLVNVATLLSLHPYYKGVVITPTIAMAMVMTGRVILNIRACDDASRQAPESASALEM